MGIEQHISPLTPPVCAEVPPVFHFISLNRRSSSSCVTSPAESTGFYFSAKFSCQGVQDSNVSPPRDPSRQHAAQSVVLMPEGINSYTSNIRVIYADFRPQVAQ